MVGLDINLMSAIDFSCVDLTVVAFFALVISLVVIGLLHLAGYRLSIVYDRYLELITAATVFSLVLSVFVYWRSHRKDALLAEGGNTGKWKIGMYVY